MQGCISFISKVPVLIVALGLFPCAGCLVGDRNDASATAKIPASVGKPPTGPIMQVHCFWNKQLMLVNDVVGGRPLAGISGRVYFFGSELKHPLATDGQCKLLVEMTYKLPDGKPETIRYEFRKHDMDSVLSRDSLGWGYTMPLPWKEYRPGIKEVAIRVTLIEEAGKAVYSRPSRFTLERPDGMRGTVRQVQVTADSTEGKQAPAAAGSTQPVARPAAAVFAENNQAAATVR